MKTTNQYPDWVEKFRGPGRTIRKVRNGYGLYECTSVYVKGQKYPRSVQNYLGMITEKDGFIPKKPRSSDSPFIEYGLSHFILANFKRDLERSLYNPSSEIIILGIIYHVFGGMDPAFISHTYVSHGSEKSLIKRIEGGVAEGRLKTISKKIASLIDEHIDDERDRDVLTGLLRLSVIHTGEDPASVIYPDEVKNIAERYGMKL